MIPVIIYRYVFEKHVKLTHENCYIFPKIYADKNRSCNRSWNFLQAGVAQKLTDLGTPEISHNYRVMKWKLTDLFSHGHLGWLIVSCALGCLQDKFPTLKIFNYYRYLKYELENYGYLSRKTVQILCYSLSWQLYGAWTFLTENIEILKNWVLEVRNFSFWLLSPGKLPTILYW
jgi:hypothetical protein